MDIIQQLPGELKSRVLDLLDWCSLVKVANIDVSLVPFMRLNKRGYLNAAIMENKNNSDRELIRYIFVRQMHRHVPVAWPALLLRYGVSQLPKILESKEDELYDLLCFINQVHYYLFHQVTPLRRETIHHLQIEPYTYFFLLRPVMHELKECFNESQERLILRKLAKRLSVGDYTIPTLLFSPTIQTRLVNVLAELIPESTQMITLRSLGLTASTLNYAVRICDILGQLYASSKIMSYGIVGDILLYNLNIFHRIDDPQIDIHVIVSDDSPHIPYVRQCFRAWSLIQNEEMSLYRADNVWLRLLTVASRQQRETIKGHVLATYLRYNARNILASCLMATLSPASTTVPNIPISDFRLHIKHTYFSPEYKLIAMRRNKLDTSSYLDFNFVRSIAFKLDAYDSLACRALRSILGLDSSYPEPIDLYNLINPNVFLDDNKTFNPPWLGDHWINCNAKLLYKSKQHKADFVE